DRRIPLDDAAEFPADRKYAQGEGRHIAELDHPVEELVAGEHGGVHCRAVRHRLVRVDGLAELLAAEHVPEQRAHLGDAGGVRQYNVTNLQYIQYNGRKQRHLCLVFPFGKLLHQPAGLLEQRLAHRVLVARVGRQRGGGPLPDGDLVAQLLHLLRLGEAEVVDAAEGEPQLDVDHHEHDQRADAHVKREGAKVYALQEKKVQ
ncbi:hypothetical protein FOCC_FOCC017557, partial [Frankliniella occidentalis]